MNEIIQISIGIRDTVFVINFQVSTTLQKHSIVMISRRFSGSSHNGDRGMLFTVAQRKIDMQGVLLRKPSSIHLTDLFISTCDVFTLFPPYVSHYFHCHTSHYFHCNTSRSIVTYFGVLCRTVTYFNVLLYFHCGISGVL